MAVILGKEDELKLLAADVQKAADPYAVDEMLTQGMMNLSMKDRNDIQEEMHGVKCLAVEETPELVEKALCELVFVLDVMTPDSKKRAYLQSKQPPMELPEHQKILQELHQLDPLPQSSYVNDVEFRLRFLRCELFDVQKAADRILLFLDLALELFGDYALRRPIRLSDFSKEEMRIMRKGRFQIMRNRDRSGRRVSTIFPEQEGSDPLIEAKITLYQSWAVGYKDVESQRKGHVIIVWFDGNAKMRTAPDKLRYRVNSSKSTRISAIHVCSPDTPYFRIRRSLAVMRTGDDNRKKLRIHLGESVELKYQLQGYGIPSEDIPISWTGNIKTKNLVSWMRIRHAVETYDEYNDSSYSSQSLPPSLISQCDIIECPNSKDVLFRKGNSYVSHSGNAKLRAMIDQYSRDHTTTRPKKLASDIFEERQRLKLNTSKGETIEKNIGDDSIGLYLVWNSKKDWWNEMTDKEQICQKIEYMVRHHRKSSSTECSGNRKRQNRSMSSNSPSTASVKLHSGTSMFRSQDGRIDDVLSGRFNKKERIQCALDCANCNYSSDDDERDVHPNNKLKDHAHDDKSFGMTLSSFSM